MVKVASVLVSLLLLTPVISSSGDAEEAADFAPMALNSYSSTTRGIVGAGVSDPMQKVVGTVERVELSVNGQPVRLWLRDNEGKQMAVAAASTSYQEPSRVVIVDVGH